MEEIWKVWRDTRYNKNGIKQNTGALWEVSNLGNVKKNYILLDLSKYIDNHGYIHFPHFLLHRIIAELFVPNPDNKPCVDHIDGNKRNNRADNLRWVTYKENMSNPITKQKMYFDHSFMIGKIWIHLLNSEKLVDEEYLEYWLDDGWLYGRIKGRKQHINKHRVYNDETHTKYHYEPNN